MIQLSPRQQRFVRFSSSFLCNIGVNYPANIKVVQIPCSGRVDMLHLLRAIEEGADGVYVAGCLEGECHFIEGNLKTKKKEVPDGMAT
jgi:coenzyme F420-reducing hydrogenase delta subunit